MSRSGGVIWNVKVRYVKCQGQLLQSSTLCYQDDMYHKVGWGYLECQGQVPVCEMSRSHRSCCSQVLSAIRMTWTTRSGGVIWNVKVRYVKCQGQLLQSRTLCYQDYWQELYFHVSVLLRINAKIMSMLLQIITKIMCMLLRIITKIMSMLLQINTQQEQRQRCKIRPTGEFKREITS